MARYLVAAKTNLHHEHAGMSLGCAAVTYLRRDEDAAAMVRFLMQRGAGINGSRNTYAVTHKWSDWPLWQAVAFGKMQTADLLLGSKADICKQVLYRELLVLPIFALALARLGQDARPRFADHVHQCRLPGARNLVTPAALAQYTSLHALAVQLGLEQGRRDDSDDGGLGLVQRLLAAELRRDRAYGTDQVREAVNVQGKQRKFKMVKSSQLEMTRKSQLRRALCG